MRMLVVFEKGALLRHIGHLDLMRAMQRALRRSGLPIAYSQGFNPHILNTFASALSVGIKGEREIMDVKLSASCGAAEFAQRLKQALPPAIVIKDVIAVEDNHPAMMALCKAAVYEVVFHEPMGEALSKAIDTLLEKKEIQAIRKTKSGMKPCDIRPMIYALTANEQKIAMTLAHDEKASLKPSLLLEVLSKEAGLETVPKHLISRTALLGIDDNGQYVPLETL